MKKMIMIALISVFASNIYTISNADNQSFNIIEKYATIGLKAGAINAAWFATMLLLDNYDTPKILYKESTLPTNTLTQKVKKLCVVTAQSIKENYKIVLYSGLLAGGVGAVTGAIW